MTMTTSVRRWGLLVAALAAAIACAVAWVNWDAWIVIPKKRAAVLGALRDPASAQFSDERITPGGYVCGRINVKNGMGGYTGFQRYASSHSDYLLEDSSPFASRQSTVEEVSQQLDWKIQFMKAKGRVPTEVDERQAAFEQRWKGICG